MNITPPKSLTRSNSQNLKLGVSDAVESSGSPGLPVLHRAGGVVVNNVPWSDGGDEPETTSESSHAGAPPQHSRFRNGRSNDDSGCSDDADSETASEAGCHVLCLRADRADPRGAPRQCARIRDRLDQEVRFLRSRDLQDVGREHRSLPGNPGPEPNNIAAFDRRDIYDRSPRTPSERKTPANA